MLRTSWALLLGMAAALPGSARAAEAGPAGTYKFTALLPSQSATLFLIDLAHKDGRWAVTVKAADDKGPVAAGVKDVAVRDGRIRFSLEVRVPQEGGAPRPTLWPFEGQFPRARGQPILGSVLVPSGQRVAVRLEPTTLTSLDPFALARETLARRPDSREALYAAQTLLRGAKEKKAKPEEIKAWADQAYRNAERYGPLYAASVARHIAQTLDAQDVVTDLALAYARRAAAAADPDAGPARQVATLDLVVALLRKANKTDEIGAYQKRIDQLAAQVYADYRKTSLPFPLEKYKGRKGRSRRAVLIEVFTGAQCKPCLADDLAFDALGRTYTPGEVVLLEYHVHIPGPDPLTSPASEARRQYYIEDVEATPSVFINGKYGAPGGGGVREARDKYQEFMNILGPLLEEPAKITLTARAVRSGDRIAVTAEASDVPRPGPKVRLRLALVEEWVKYTGGNRLPYHRHVVRAMPGGPDGLALTGKSGKLTAAVDLAKLRRELATYLETYAKKKRFPNPARPLALNNLRVVAFVQDDATKEVLQAVEVKVEGGK